MFTISAFIVLVTSLYSGRLMFLTYKKAARSKEASAAVEAQKQHIEFEKSLAAAKKVELDDMDVEFDDFFDDDPVPTHDPLDYLVPDHLRYDAEAMGGGGYHLVEERLKKQHSVFGVPLHKAQEEVRRRVGASSDLRLDRIERSMRLRSEALRAVGGPDGDEITRGLVSMTSGIDVMHTTVQVQPVGDLGELPWLTREEVDIIQSAQMSERRQMIENSGRDAERALTERTTIDLAGDGGGGGSPDDNMTSVSRNRKHHQSSPPAKDNRSSVTESVLRTAHRAGDLASNASFLMMSSDRQRRGSLHQRVMQNALDAASASDIGSSNGSFYGHRSSSALRATSPSGRSQEVETWEDVKKRGGRNTAALYQFSHSPMERMRTVRDRVEVGPLRGAGASFSGAVVVAPLATTEMQYTTQYLPDPDEDTFVGIDLDYRLTDADL